MFSSLFVSMVMQPIHSLSPGDALVKFMALWGSPNEKGQALASDFGKVGNGGWDTVMAAGADVRSVSGNRGLMGFDSVKTVAGPGGAGDLHNTTHSHFILFDIGDASHTATGCCRCEQDINDDANASSCACQRTHSAVALACTSQQFTMDPHLTTIDGLTAGSCTTGQTQLTA